MPRRIIVSSALNPEIVANRNMVRAYRPGARPVFAPPYRLTMVLGIGIVALLLKGLIYEGAVVLAVILVILVYTRPEFQRKGGSLFEQGYPAEWVSTLTAILAVTVWFGLFSYKALEYSHELWWHFEYDVAECYYMWQFATISDSGQGKRVIFIVETTH